MKNILILGLLVLSAITFAQTKFGVKAGLDFNASEGVLASVNQAYEDKGKNGVGFHLGGFGRIGLGGLFIQPELLYTQFKTEFQQENQNTFDVTRKRLDLPVLAGTRFLRLVSVKAGPVFSYNFDDKIDLTLSDFEQENFSLALQLGAGVELNRLHVDLRYEFNITEAQTTFGINTGDFEIDNSPNLLRLSVGISL